MSLAMIARSSEIVKNFDRSTSILIPLPFQFINLHKFSNTNKFDLSISPTFLK